jgi:hypothetical protein
MLVTYADADRQYREGMAPTQWAPDLSRRLSSVEDAGGESVSMRHFVVGV